MATIPTWLLGRHVTAVTIQTFNESGGTLSSVVGSTPLTGQLDEITIEDNPDAEEISPMDSKRKHMEIIADGFEMTLVEILKRSGTNFLAQAAMSGDWMLITFTRGGQTWKSYFTRGRYMEGIRRGKSVATLGLVPVTITNSSVDPDNWTQYGATGADAYTTP